MPKRNLPILIAVFFTLTFSSCTCIYFNTFHNIRKNFNGAEKARKKDGREKAKGAEVKQYNDAITKASKVLERHPTSSWVDDALYIIGASYYYLGEYSKSSRKFKELFANYPNSEYVSRARVLLAKAKLQLDEEAEAVVIFEEIFETETDKKMKANAARSLGEYYFEAKDFAKADKYFTALIDSLGDNEDKLRALLYVADGHYERYAFGKAMENYKEALKHDPDTLQYYRINFRMADCQYFLNDLAGGLERLQELADDDIYYDSLAAIRLKMAEGYEWDGDFEAATAAYEKVIVENEGKDAAAVAYYNLGLINQYDFEDLQAAREYYVKARDERRNSSVYQDATRRASKLTMMEKYIRSGEASLAIDSTDEKDKERLDLLIENQFLLGELFYFDLEKPDSALHAFKAVYDRFPETDYAPQALMSMAYIQRYDYGDTAAADSLLREVLKQYPHYDEAEEVIEMLGLVGTVADTGYAAVVFERAESFLEQFIQLDSSRYYIRLWADSVVAADTLPDDSAGIEDSLQAFDSLPIIDAIAGEDTLGAEANIRATDTLPKLDSAAQEALRVQDSIRVADSIKYADARRAADSIRAAYMERHGGSRKDDTVTTEDSASAADSIKATELMRAAGSEQVESDSGDGERLTDMIRSEISASGDQSGQVPGDSGDKPMTTTDPAMPTDSLAAEDISGPDTFMTGDSSLPDTTGAKIETGFTGDSLSVSDMILAEDSAAITDSTIFPDGPTGLDTMHIIDISQTDSTEAEEPAIDYWQLAYEAGPEKFEPDLWLLLDSAQYYYHRVIEDYPHSDYSVQARFVLLWIYDNYLAPGDSSLIDLYGAFVDSFPQSDFAQVIAEEYNIRSTKTTRKTQTGQSQQQQQQDMDEQEIDSSAFALDDDSTNYDPNAPAPGSAESKFITDADGNILEPAEKYFLREEVEFKYPLEALAYNIEDKLYFHIRIDFMGEVAEAILMNETQSPELNARILEVVRRTFFDNGKIPPDLFDHWFYYTYTVRIPQELRQ